MNDLFILDYQKNTVGVLSNRMPFSMPFYEDIQEKSLDDFTDTLTFQIPANHEKSDLITADNYILYPEKNGNLKLYKIQELTDSHSGDNYKEVYAELSAQDDLIKDVVRPLTFNSASLEEVLTAILLGSEWSVGMVEDFGLLDYEIVDYPTKLQAVIDVCTAYGAEYEYEYETVGTTVINQHVNAYVQLGEETGKPFMIGKDIKGVERSEDRTKLVTAMIGVGKETDGVALNFTKETEAQLGTQLGGFPKGYEKPTGVDYVGNLDALQMYSRTGQHIYGVYKDTEAQSSYELFVNTYEALKTYSKPIVTYTVEVALLEQLAGYSHEEVNLGDTIVVQDKEVSPELYVKARIRKTSLSLCNPENDTVELGDYIPVVPSVNRQIADMQSKISKNEETWNKAIEIDAIQEHLNNVPTMEDIFSTQAQRLKVRYIRDWINGSSAGVANHWVEFSAMRKGVNIAKGIMPTFSKALSGSAKGEYVTDGIVDSNMNAWTGAGLNYMELDLGQVYEDVEYLQVWHLYSDGRTYNQHLVDVSEDGVNWVRLFNSDKNGTHKETATGFIVAVNSSAVLQTQKDKESQLEQSQQVIVTEVDELKDFKQSAEVTLQGKVDLTEYNGRIQELNESIASKVGLEYVNGQLADKANKDEVVTIETIETGYVSKVQYTTDSEGIVSKLDNQESRITQSEKDISLKVSRDEAESIAKAENSLDVRFLRYLGSGNSVDNDSSLLEIAVYDTEGVNVALGKTVTGAVGATGLPYITDGVIDNALATNLGEGDTEAQWLMIDLGQIYSGLSNLKVWHSYSEIRSYFYNLQVSIDGVNWLSLYNSSRDGEYTVSSAGYEIPINQQKAIYSHQAEITANADALSLKAEASIVDDLGIRVSQAEELITPDAIISTVMSETSSVAEALNNKADASAVDGKADRSELADLTADIATNYVTSTQLKQNSEDFDFKFSKGGGVNLIKNSVGFAGFDFWENTYGTAGLYNVSNTSLDALGFGSGFHMTPNGLDKGIHQDIFVEAGQTYTLSWYMNKMTKGANATYKVYVQVMEGDEVKAQASDNSAEATSGYEKYSLTFTPNTNIIRLRLGGFGNVEAVLSGIMLNIGQLPLQWSMAAGEVYNSNVVINANGIKVMSSTYDGYTSITPEEFAGYYNDNGVEKKIFTLNKDTTVISKAEIQQEIRMSPIKVVPILSDTLNGWAFVIDEE